MPTHLGPLPPTWPHCHLPGPTGAGTGGWLTEILAEWTSFDPTHSTTARGRDCGVFVTTSRPVSLCAGARGLLFLPPTGPVAGGHCWTTLPLPSDCGGGGREEGGRERRREARKERRIEGKNRRVTRKERRIGGRKEGEKQRGSLGESRIE